VTKHIFTVLTNLFSIQWRVPLALACLTPCITLLGIYWIPESPRYLCWVDRKDEAWEILRKLHEDPRDPDESSARAEFQQIVLQVEYDKQQSVSYIKMFRVPSWRRRSLLAIMLLFGTQSGGVLGIGNFQILMYQSLGLSGYLPLLFYCIYALLPTILNYVCAATMDRIGRRKLLREWTLEKTVMKLTCSPSYWISNSHSCADNRNDPTEGVHWL
jgi:MFS family permease